MAGEYGVWVFWCISGFIFFWKYRDAIADRSMHGWTFLVYRLSRLYPLHFVTLLIVALLQPIYFRQHGYFFVYQANDLQHFVLQIFMASDWVVQRPQQFQRADMVDLGRGSGLHRLFPDAEICHQIPVAESGGDCRMPQRDGQLSACLAFFYAGGLAAIARQSLTSMRLTVAIERVGWLFVVVFPASIWLLGLQSRIVDWILLLSYTPVLLFCLTCKIALPASAAKLVEAAGNMTYSSYLLHFPIQLLIALGFAMSGSPIPFYDGWFFAAFVTATLLASYLTYRYFEAPAQALLRNTLLRNRLPAERVPALPQAQPPVSQ